MEEARAFFIRLYIYLQGLLIEKQGFKEGGYVMPRGEKELSARSLERIMPVNYTEDTRHYLSLKDAQPLQRTDVKFDFVKLEEAINKIRNAKTS